MLTYYWLSEYNSKISLNIHSKIKKSIVFYLKYAKNLYYFYIIYKNNYMNRLFNIN